MGSQLKLGRMSFEELGEWRGVKPQNFNRNFNTRWKEELEEYCEFTRYKEGRKYAGIEISKIYEPVYIKRGSKDYERMKKFAEEHVKKNPDITTGVWVAINYLKNFPDCELKKVTIAKYANKINNEYFGDGRKKKEGIKGTSKIVTGISKNSEPRVLTPEEEERRFELYQKYYVEKQKESCNITKEELEEILCSEELEHIEINNEGILINEEELKKVTERYKKFKASEAFKDFMFACLKEFGGWPIQGKKYTLVKNFENNTK